MIRNTSYTYTGITYWKFKNPSIFHYGGSSIIRKIFSKSKNQLIDINNINDINKILPQIKDFEDITNSDLERIILYNDDIRRKENEQKERKKIESQNIDISDSEQSERSMSKRTKHKILNKLFALNEISQKLTFVTLTFQNEVEDKQAVQLLNIFLTQSRKKLGTYNYLWVAEQQTNNKTFKNNIHFHIVTDRRWNIPYWLNYWQQIQVSKGITPKNNFATSAFNVKSINTSQKIFGYVAKYVTKNQTTLGCQVWNCSRSVSNLFVTYNSSNEYMQYMMESGNNNYTNPKNGDVITSEPKDYEYSIFLKIRNFSRYHAHFQQLKNINCAVVAFFNSENQPSINEFHAEITNALMHKHFC